MTGTGGRAPPRGRRRAGGRRPRSPRAADTVARRASCRARSRRPAPSRRRGARSRRPRPSRSDRSRRVWGGRAAGARRRRRAADRPPRSRARRSHHGSPVAGRAAGGTPAPAARAAARARRRRGRSRSRGGPPPGTARRAPRRGRPAAHRPGRSGAAPPAAGRRPSRGRHAARATPAAGRRAGSGTPRDGGADVGERVERRRSAEQHRVVRERDERHARAGMQWHAHRRILGGRAAHARRARQLSGDRAVEAVEVGRKPRRGQARDDSRFVMRQSVTTHSRPVSRAQSSTASPSRRPTPQPRASRAPRRSRGSLRPAEARGSCDRTTSRLRRRSQSRSPRRPARRRRS